MRLKQRWIYVCGVSFAGSKNENGFNDSEEKNLISQNCCDEEERNKETIKSSIPRQSHEHNKNKKTGNNAIDDTAKITVQSEQNEFLHVLIFTWFEKESQHLENPHTFFYG